MWKKIIQSSKIIKKSEPQVSHGLFNDMQYRENLIAASQDNPEILNDDYYKMIVS